MQPRDAIEYGVIDGVVRNETSIIDAVMSPEQDILQYTCSHAISYVIGC